MTKAFAPILAVLLTVSAGSPVTCAGWEQSAADRHACCLRAHHAHANDQTAADDCCARHEQGRHSEHATRVVSDDAPALVVAALPWLDATRNLSAHAVVVHGRAPLPFPPDPSPPPLRI